MLTGPARSGDGAPGTVVKAMARPPLPVAMALAPQAFAGSSCVSRRSAGRRPQCGHCKARSYRTDPDVSMPEDIMSERRSMVGEGGAEVDAKSRKQLSKTTWS